MKTKLYWLLLMTLLFSSNFTKAQLSWLTTGNNITGTEYLGGDGTSSVPLRLKTKTNNSIDFFINNSTNPTMSHTTNGDLDITTGNRGYLINGQYVLRHNAITTSIYVGIGAGNSDPSTFNNTFIGFNVGVTTTYTSSTTNGSNNTFVGYSAGTATSTGEKNCFYGVDAGISNTTGISNIFTGFSAGYNNTTGSWNTMTGHLSGYENTTANSNCYYGKWSGHDNTVGRNNSIYGSHSGQKAGASGVENDSNCFFGNYAAYGFNSGHDNIFIGSRAQYDYLQNSSYSHAWNNVSNAIAIGANAIVPASNQMILGDNNVDVGIGLSGDNASSTAGPGNKLEINARTTGFSHTHSGGTGLRFRQVWKNDPIVIPPWGGVLTVDADGDVDLTIGGGIGFGRCENEVTVLDYDGQMDFHDYNLRIRGQGNSLLPYQMIDAFGIGYDCNEALPGKLSVKQSYAGDVVDAPTIAGYFSNEDYSPTASNYWDKCGVYSRCNGLSDFYGDEGGFMNFGGDFQAINSTFSNVGVRGRSGNLADQEYNYGLYGTGGFFTSENSTVKNYGVIAIAVNGGVSSTNYGIYADGTDYAGYFNGDIICMGGYLYSDSILKDNINPLQNGLSIINSLNPKTYIYRNAQFPSMNLPSTQCAGLLAQDVKNVLPELVKEFKCPPKISPNGISDTTGTNTTLLSINYEGLIPYLISAVKEQQTLIDSLQAGLTAMQSQINNCCGTGLLRMGNDNNENGDGSTINVELSDITTIILQQNQPNPFQEETYINYVVPKEVSKAVIMIYDNVGQVLKTVTISSRGEGSIHVYAENLSSGIYSYSLIADGKVIDTKKMVCQK